jgi:hypothetical protein
MESLFKRTIAFTKPQMNALKTKAEKLGISVADLVRRIVDEWRNNEQ